MPKTIARLLSVRLRKEALFYKDYVFLALFLLVAAGNLFAQPVTQPAQQKNQKEIIQFEDLKKDISGILQDPSIKNAFWGISIQSLKTGESFYELNEKKSFIPASNLKLVTAAAALTLLSPSFQFTTELYTNGKIVKGVLKGDLIIRGAGDPTFGSPSMYPEKDPTFVFKAWADTLTKHGIQKIEGNIIADDSYFTDDEYPVGWSIDDASYSYAMQTSALSFADNSVSVSVSPNLSTGSKPFVAVIPETDYIEKNNTAVTLEKKKPGDTSAVNSITVTRDLGTNTINISGEIIKGTPATLEQISVESPSLYAGNVLREVLEYEGITVTGGTMTSAELKEKIPYQSLQLLAQNVSPPLSDIIAVMNKKSNNFYAEQIFRTLAKETGGEGSWKAGAKVVQNYIASLGISAEYFSIRDGSGLSRMNLVTPEGMVQILRSLYRDTKLHKPFTESLPIMGKDGTLQERLKNTPAEGNVIAKTGLLTGERSLSGYLTTKDNETVVFSILVNNYTSPVKDINNIQDLIMLRLVNFSRK